MTTLKEYKAMMEGATDAPWEATSYEIYGAAKYDAEGVWPYLGELNGQGKTENKSNADFIAASRNIAPSLIRVIELAEYALDRALQFKTSEGQENIVQQALSEIRNLKGE